MSELARRALAANQAMLALGNEVFQADGATFVRNRALPNIRDANHVAHVTAATPAETDRLLARVEREFAGYRYRRFDLDCTTPPAFEARLAHEDYQCMDLLVMLLDGEISGGAKEHDIRSAEDQAGWRDYAALNEVDWKEYAEQGSPGGEWSAEAMFRARRIKSPPARYWVAYVDGEPRAYCASWSGIDGVGLVDDLFTHPDLRHRGLATALIHRCVADCREGGAGPVVIVAGPHDTPKRMYAALGFRPLAITRTYWKLIEGWAGPTRRN